MKFKNKLTKIYKKLTAKNAEGASAIFDSVAFYAIFSLILEFVIEILSNHSITAALKFLVFNPFGFLINALIIFFTLSFSFFIPKRSFTFFFISIIWFGLGFANFVLQFKRVTPLTAVDFTLIPSVAKIFSVYLTAFEIIGIAILFIITISLLVFAAIKLRSYKVNLKKAAAITVSLALSLIISLNVGIWTSALSTDFYNLNNAYADYGFPFCFVAGAFDRGIDKPSQYSEYSIADILNKIDVDETGVPDSKPNIIYVQLESFFDVNYLDILSFSENPVLYFEQLKKEGLSGFLTVPVIGSGTVNTEFEVLSGMDLDFFGAGEYPYKTVLKNYTCETVAYDLMEIGYSTHAVHNYEGSFYDRNEVYPHLGFESFTSIEYMNKVEYNASGKWPDDSILTSQITDALKSTSGPDFVMAVSVQGHGKYPPSETVDGYNERISVSYADGYEGDTDLLPSYSYYVNQIDEMDDFIKELVSAVKKLDEETVIVFYGDHLPSLFIKNEDLSNGNIYTTEYVMVSNFGLEERAERIGDISTYQLSAKVLKTLGIENGILTKFHQKCANEELYMEWFHDLSYDMLYGKRYVYGGNKERYPVLDMKMGIRDIKINDCRLENGYLYVTGENFTKWSVIEVNGRLFTDTEMIGEDLIRVRYTKSPDNISQVAVVQYSATNVVLSTTEPFAFEHLNQ